MKTQTIAGVIIIVSLIMSLSINTFASHSDAAVSLDTLRWHPIVPKNSCDTKLHTFVHSSPDTITRYQQLYRVFDTLCYSNRPLRVLHIGDSHVAGKSFPMEIKQYLADAFGMASADTAGVGINYSYIAKNGATALNFLTPERQRSIAAKNADLVIMSFGTNECHGMGYREAEHRTALSAAVDNVRKLCPGATILLTTPPGDYLTRRTRYYVRGRDGKRYRRYRTRSNPNPMTPRCAALICKYAAEQNIPVWDLNTIAGGSMAVRNWQKHNMMRRDKIHYYPEGYAFHARMFGEAFVKAYNEYYYEQDFNDKSSKIIETYVEH